MFGVIPATIKDVPLERRTRRATPSGLGLQRRRRRKAAKIRSPVLSFVFGRVVLGIGRGVWDFWFFCADEGGVSDVEGSCTRSAPAISISEFALVGIGIERSSVVVSM